MFMLWKNCGWEMELNGEIDEKTLENHSKDLFAIAHKYQVKQLMDVCEDYMISTIAAQNFSQFFLFAELYRLSKLERACVNFLSANKQSFLVSKEWKEFKSLNKDFAIHLLESSALNEEKQIEEKQVVSTFVCSDCERRRNHPYHPSWSIPCPQQQHLTQQQIHPYPCSTTEPKHTHLPQQKGFQ